jgi:putative hydrolase of the HAD superfamily
LTSSRPTLFLDLDETLYPGGSGLWAAIGERIHLFLTDRMRLPLEEADRLRAQYLERYGTTLQGLVRHHGVDPVDYLEFVHDLPLGSYLQPDAELQRILAGLAFHRVVFTNSHRGHAMAVLRALDIESEVDQIVDILALELHNKPMPEAYVRALRLVNDPSPQACVMVDDLPRNLDPARRLGMRTILVGPTPQAPTVHIRIDSIHGLAKALVSSNDGNSG